MSATVAVIPARGGSKGLPKKNLVELCGKPLLAWSVMQAKAAESVDSVWVSSDSEEILEVAVAYGAGTIQRPDRFSGDRATSESAWLHAMDWLEEEGISLGRVVAMQATSPLREPHDLDEALQAFETEAYDSLLSVTEIDDFFMWALDSDGQLKSVNHDYRNRQRRQAIEKRYLENGSFYIFRPSILREHNNRLGGRIGMHVMAKHKMFQIDTAEDVRLCAAIMRGYALDRI